MLDLDTLRPDHLGCYGYHRDTSPNIDKIAEKGIRLNNCYTSNAPCLPSRTALHTGKRGLVNGVVGHGGSAAELNSEGEKRSFRSELSETSLAGFLRNNGFRTVTFSPFAERHGAWNFYAGFEEMYNTGKKGLETAGDITPRVKKWLKDNIDSENWFLHINFWDPHTPYRTPEEFGNPFSESPLPPRLDDEDMLKRHRELAGPHKPREISMFTNKSHPDYPRQPGELEDLDDLKKLVDGYDCGIRFMDQHIGGIIKLLKKENIYDNTAIIVTADHGENFGELGIYSEHATADEATCKIPLIIKWPGGEKNLSYDGFYYNFDLLPTIAELINADEKNSWQGKSFAGVIKNGVKSQGRNKLILTQGAHVCQRSVRFDKWLYIRTYHCGYHLFPREMLFDIENDPMEQENLAKKFPSVCQKGARILLEWWEKMLQTEGVTQDPLFRVLQEGGPYHAKGNLLKYIEHLNNTNREEAVKKLKRKYPEELD